MITHSGYDRLLMGSPLRRGGVGKAIAATLIWPSSVGVDSCSRAAAASTGNSVRPGLHPPIRPLDSKLADDFPTASAELEKREELNQLAIT